MSRQKLGCHFPVGRFHRPGRRSSVQIRPPQPFPFLPLNSQGPWALKVGLSFSCRPISSAGAGGRRLKSDARGLSACQCAWPSRAPRPLGSPSTMWLWAEPRDAVTVRLLARKGSSPASKVWPTSADINWVRLDVTAFDGWRQFVARSNREIMQVRKAIGQQCETMS